MNLLSSILGRLPGRGKNSSSAADGDLEGISLFHKLNYIFDKKQKRQFLLLGVMILIGGLFETLGVSMLLPVVQMITDPAEMQKKIAGVPLLGTVLDRLGLRSISQLTILLLAALTVLVGAFPGPLLGAVSTISSKLF